MRILIIKPSSLGDVVHALPTVNLIRRRFPDAHLAWLINDTLASLLKNCSIIDELITFPRQRFGSAKELPAFGDFLAVLQGKGFDIVVDLQGLFRSGLMSWATLATRRIGLSDAREGARLFYNEVVEVRHPHAVDRYLRAARHLGCGDGPIEFPLGSSDADRKYVDELLAHLASSLIPHPSSFVAVNPSARWETKLWGVDNYRALAQRLPRERVVFTGSSSEANWIGRLAQGCLNLAGKTDLAQLAELYRRCALLITNDSGPMHIAAAVGTPVVAIFGPTDPALTGPYGKQHVVLRAGIPCSPCLKPYCTHTPRMECMSLVTVEQVLAAVQPFI
jgi:lipopolysaccharide heptosyltransferase I